MDLPKIDTAAPERIWLECCDDGSLAPFAGWNDVEEDEAQRAEYVRADLYDALKSANQELALQVLASDGQAQEALERAMKAEAEVARLREAGCNLRVFVDLYGGSDPSMRLAVSEWDKALEGTK